jgi:hypothetical protein
MACVTAMGRKVKFDSPAGSPMQDDAKSNEDYDITFDTSSGKAVPIRTYPSGKKPPKLPIPAPVPAPK